MVEQASRIGAFRIQKKEKQRPPKKRRNLATVLTFFGLALACASWGYFVLAPNPNIMFGSMLLASGFVFCALAFWEYFEWSARVKAPILVIASAASAIFGTGWVRDITRQSFPLIKPAWIINQNSPNAYRVFLVANRGRTDLYNVGVVFQDMVRTDQVSEQSKAGLPVAALMQSEMTRLHYDELDHNPVGGKDNELAQFSWVPAVMGDEHYDILSKYRNGEVREELYIKKPGTEWQFAMRVTDERDKQLLIECRDPLFPVGGEWKQELPKCFPDY